MRTKTELPDHKKIASFIFLDKYRSRNQEDASGVMYNKFMTLLSSALKEKRIDIGLPHCWYRWGDEVVRFHMPYLRWNHEDPGYTAVVWKGNIPRYEGDDPVISAIKDFSDDFIDEYSGSEGMERVIDKVYENAPFKFQNEYRKLRENLKIAKKSVPPDNYVRSVLMPLFKSAMSSFPKAFSHMNDIKNDFMCVFAIAAEEGATTSELFDIAEDFWFFFCYHLRLNPKCHENVPRSTLDIWADILPWESEMYERNLWNNIHRFYKKHGSDPTADRLSEEWKRDMDEFEKLLSEYPDGMDDMDSVLYGKDR